jgi:Flp pilus assembly protein TadG
VVLKQRGCSRRRAVGRGDDGVSLILVALSLVAILGIVAVVVDLGNARQVRRGEQSGVDAAALAAARDLPVKSDNTTTRTTKQSQARNTAMIYAVHNLVSPTATPPTCGNSVTCTGTVGKVDLTVTTPWNPTTMSLPANTSDSSYIGYVYVQACQNTASFFAPVVGQRSPRVCRSAVGRYLSTGAQFDYGLVSTDPSKCGALQFEGNSSTVLTSNGAVMVNSNCASGNTQALDSSGTSWQLQFVDTSGNKVPGYVGVVGGATLAPCDPLTQTTKCTSTVPTTGLSPFGDPLDGLTAPANPGGTPKTCDNNGGDITPGLYSGCKVTSNGANLNMQPGVYYINGDLTFTGGDISCVDGPTMKCTGPASPSPYTNATGSDPAGILIFVTGTITLTGNGRVYLPPYSSSCTPKYTGTCYDGLSLWQTGSSTATINGTNNFGIGTVYVPNALLKANGSGGSAQVNITGIVVSDTVLISGTFGFNISVPQTAPNTDPEISFGLEK